MSKIQQTLTNATGVKEEGDRQSFLGSIVRAVSELDDGAWESLGADAQNWYNDAADAMNAKNAVPEFPDYAASAAPSRRRAVPAAAPAPEKSEEKSVAKPAAAKPAAKPKAEEKPAAPAPSGRKGGGVTARMREIICGDFTLSKEKVAEKLKGENVEFRDATLDIMFSDTHKVIECLQALGKL